MNQIEGLNDESENRKTPDYMFYAEEKEIIIKCINILTSDYFLTENEFINLTTSDDKSRFVETANKLRENRELNKDDGDFMAEAVAHIAMYPMRRRDEVVGQFDIKLYQLYWLKSHIRNTFEIIFAPEDESN